MAAAKTRPKATTRKVEESILIRNGELRFAIKLSHKKKNQAKTDGQYIIVDDGKVEFVE